MPRINTYSDNASIENDDKLLTYDTQGTATKLTAFSTIWNWIVSKLHALTSSSAALTPSTDRVLMDKNGTMTRVEPAAVAKYGIETYNGSTIAGSAQTVKSALDTLNSKVVLESASITVGAWIGDAANIHYYSIELPVKTGYRLASAYVGQAVVMGFMSPESGSNVYPAILASQTGMSGWSRTVYLTYVKE